MLILTLIYGVLWSLAFERAIVKAKLAERRRTTNFLPVGHKINSIIL